MTWRTVFSRSGSTIERLMSLRRRPTSDDADIAAAYLLGANGYLVKPNGIAEYAEVAKALRDFWLTMNRVPSGAVPIPPSPPAPSSGKPQRRK